MKKIIPIMILLLLPGCMALKGAKQADINVKGESEIPYKDPYGFIDPTVEGRSVWLDSFIESSKSMRQVSKNFYLHNSTTYQKELVEQNDKFFDRVLLKRGEFRLSMDEQNVELRERLIKALLLVVQIRLDTYLPAQEGESPENVVARKNIALLKDVVHERDDLDVRDLGLSCRSLQQCLEKFENITRERE